MDVPSTIKMSGKPLKTTQGASRIPTSGRDSGTHSRSSSVSNLTAASDIHSESGDAATDFKIDDKVWVNGTKPGVIKFLGSTKFAPGLWAGIYLDEAIGKNDGSVGGVSYFACEPQKGIFARPSKLTRTACVSPVIGDSTLVSGCRTPNVPSSKSSVISAISPRGVCSRLRNGERVVVNSNTGIKSGILKYIGEAEFAKGEWAGIELDEPVGKNDGSVAGKRYFECKAKHGLFAPIHKVSRAGGTSASRAGSVRESPLTSRMRSGSKDSLCSSISTASKSSRVKLGVTSLTNSQKTTRGSSPGIMTNSRALEEALKEKEQHIEQLLKERALERDEMVRITSQFKEVQEQLSQTDTKVVQLKNQCEQSESQKKEMDDIVSKFQRKLEDFQFQLEEEKIAKENMESELQQNKQVLSQIEEFATQKLGDKSQGVMAIIRGQEYESIQNQEENEVAVELAKLKGLSEEKEEALSKMNQELTSTLQKLNSLHDENVTLKQQLSQTKDEAETVISQSQEKMDQLKAEMEKLSSTVAAEQAAEVATLQALQQKLIEADASKQALESQVSNKEQEIGLLKTKVEELSKCEQENNTLLAQKNEELSEKCKELEAQTCKLSSIEEDCKGLKRQLAEKEEKASELETAFGSNMEQLQNEMQTAIFQKEEKILCLLKEMQDLREDSECRESKWREQLDAKEQMIQDLGSELSKAKEEVAALESMASLETELANASQELEASKQKLDALSSELENVTQQSKTKADALSEKEQDLASLSEKSHCLENELSDLREKWQSLVEEKEEATKQLERMKQDMMHAKEEMMEEKDREIAAVQSKLELAEQKLLLLNQDSSQQVLALQEELSSSHIELSEFKGKYEELIGNLKEIEAKLKETETCLNKLQLSVDDKESQKSDLTCQLQNMKKEMEDIKKNFAGKEALFDKIVSETKAKCETELSEKLKLLAESENKLASYSQLSEDKGREVTKKDSEIDMLKRMVEEKEQQFEQLSGMIESSQGQLVQLKQQNENNLHLLQSKESFIQEFRAEQEKKIQIKEGLFKEQLSKLQLSLSEKEKEMKMKEENFSNVSSEMEKYKNQIEELQLELQKTNENKENILQDSSKINQEFNQRIEDLQEKFNKLLTEKEKLAQEELAARDAKKGLESIRDSLMQEKDAQEKLVQDREAKLEALQVEVNRMQEQFSQHKQELQQKLDISEMELQAAIELKNELEVQHCVSEELQQQLQNSEDLRKELELKVQNVLDASSKKDEMVTASEKRLTELEKEYTEEAEKIFEVEQENISLKDLLDKCQRLLKQKEENIEKIRQQLEQHEAEKSLLNAKVTLLESQSSSSAKVTSDQLSDEDQESLKGQIDFLNTIIVDLKNKNEELKNQLDIASNVWEKPEFNINDYSKVAPRLFCDICDMFDLHETEDCPKQDSDAAGEIPQKKPKEPQSPRPYCNNCEIFGHWTYDCKEEENFF